MDPSPDHPPEASCRICFEETSSFSELIAPCRCTGPISYRLIFADRVDGVLTAGSVQDLKNSCICTASGVGRRMYSQRHHFSLEGWQARVCMILANQPWHGMACHYRHVMNADHLRQFKPGMSCCALVVRQCGARTYLCTCGASSAACVLFKALSTNLCIQALICIIAQHSLS